jgi:hypothetical protein
VVNQSHSYDEIQVFEAQAERTGNRLDRTSIRGRSGFCRSLAELNVKFRRFGDGFYYLAEGAWPEDAKTLDLRAPAWQGIG